MQRCVQPGRAPKRVTVKPQCTEKCVWGIRLVMEQTVMSGETTDGTDVVSFGKDCLL
jgi:hypothetical protein